MRYIDVKWRHSDRDSPIRMISEIDDNGWERRKVELFEDGSIGFASETESAHATMLGLEIVPSLTEINQNPVFEGREITSQEFEHMWAKAKGGFGMD